MTTDVICFFDFDGTITDRDSLPDFIQYAVGKPAYYLGLLVLSPMLLSYLLKITPNDVAKEKILAHYFTGWAQDRFEDIARRYSLERIPDIIRPEARERLRWHQQQNHEIVVVSASMKNWLEPWCRQTGVKLLSTQLEISGGRLSGRFATPNCHGKEKANRISKRFDLESYTFIYAYGDSSGDTEMLALANEAQYKPFR